MGSSYDEAQSIYHYDNPGAELWVITTHPPTLFILYMYFSLTCLPLTCGIGPCVFCHQAFLKSLNPLGDMSEKMFNDYLYGKSLELEPRNARQLPKCVSMLDFVASDLWGFWGWGVRFSSVQYLD